MSAFGSGSGRRAGTGGTFPRDDGARNPDGADEGRYPERRHRVGLRGDAHSSLTRPSPGGVSHRGRDGVFAMELHEHDKYNGSLRARKSWFFFDNRIVCMGSDIEQGRGGVHTTLFRIFWRTRPIRSS